MDDGPEKIPDPEAKKPEDWDDEEVRESINQYYVLSIRLPLFAELLVFMYVCVCMVCAKDRISIKFLNTFHIYSPLVGKNSLCAIEIE